MTVNNFNDTDKTVSIALAISKKCHLAKYIENADNINHTNSSTRHFMHILSAVNYRYIL